MSVARRFFIWSFDRAIIIVLGLVLTYFVIDKCLLERHASTSTEGASSMAATPHPAIVDSKSIAVLPFTDMSEKKAEEYFSDGLSEELIDMLTKVPDLRVPARRLSFHFKGKQASIADIAKALNVPWAS
jgi:TolB-like protein